MKCPYCDAESKYRGRWRGYYRYRCANGHRWGLATPKQVVKNWRSLSATGSAEPS